MGAGNPCDALLQHLSCIPCVGSPVPRELQGQLSLPSGFLFAPQNLLLLKARKTSCRLAVIGSRAMGVLKAHAEKQLDI